MKDNFFDNFKILDGGMGQELLARGVKPISNLWSATALMNKDYHQIIKDCHLDFINSGAEIILTNTFGCRRRRLEENQIENRFEELNMTAVKLAKQSVKESGKKTSRLTCSSIPTRTTAFTAGLPACTCSPR